LNFLNLFGKHEIDAWRDDYTLMAASSLNEVTGNLIASFEDDLETATWKDGLIGQNAFLANRVNPRIHEVARPLVDHIVQRANEALARIVAHQAIWQYRPTDAPAGEGAFEGWQDVAVAAAPLAGGVATAVALPAMAVTTSAAFFGLVTTTVVSWPIVVGGGAVAAVGIGTGLINAGKIWDKTEARLRRKVHDHVVATLLVGEKQPSVLEQLTDAFAATAKEAKRR
jgi:hypothetical protein